MIEQIAPLLPLGQQALFSGFAVFLRIGALMALIPAFGERVVPMRVRLALTLAFTLVVAPAIAPDLQDGQTFVDLLGQYLLPEVLIGLALGIILRLIVLVLMMAGQIAAQATSLSQILGGATVDPQPAMSHLLVMAGLALAVMTGLHVRLAGLMVLSYDMLPAGQLPSASLLADWGIGQIVRGFALSLSLAMPFVIAALIYNLALGVINRAMPQLMVAFVGAPAITAGGLLLLLIAAPSLLELWRGWMSVILDNPFGVAP